MNMNLTEQRQEFSSIMYSTTLYQKTGNTVEMKIWTAVSTKYYHNRLLINRVFLTYYSVCVLSFLCLEPLWETGETYETLLRKNS